MTTGSASIQDYLNNIAQLQDEGLTHLEDSVAEALLLRDREAAFVSVARIVPYIIHKHWPHRVYTDDYADLVQEGNIGILKGMQSWIPYKGSSLATWCYDYAKTYVSREIDRIMAYEQSVDVVDPHQYADSTCSDRKLDKSDTMPGEQQGIVQRGLDWQLEYETIRKQLSHIDQLLLDLDVQEKSVRSMAKIIGKSYGYTAKLLQGMRLQVKKIWDNRTQN